MKKKNVHYAGFWRRLSASFIDGLITAPIAISLLYLFGLEQYLMVEIDEDIYSYIENQKASGTKVIIDVISIIIAAIYSVFLVSSNKKATIGKMIFGIQVVDVHGKKLTRVRAFSRFLSSILAAIPLGIGLIMIAFTKEKTGLHDLICSTRVIKKEK